MMRIILFIKSIDGEDDDEDMEQTLWMDLMDDDEPLNDLAPVEEQPLND